MDISRKMLRRLSEYYRWRSRDVAIHLGVSQRTIQRWWKEQRMSPPKPDDVLTEDRLQYLYSWGERDLTLDELAAISPWSRTTIVTHLDMYNLLGKQYRG